MGSNARKLDCSVKFLSLDRREVAVAEIVPAPDPWDVVLRLEHLPHLVFLDSADRHPTRGRYSYVTADPVKWYSAKCAEIRGTNPFHIIDESLPESRIEPIPGLPPFQGGLVGALGYGLNRILEPRVPANKYRDLDLPDMVVGTYDWVISFDHLCNRCWLIAWDFRALGLRVQKGGDARHRISEIITWLKSNNEFVSNKCAATEHTQTKCHTTGYKVNGSKEIYSNFDCNSYLNIIQKTINYIKNGDCFQVNLSQRLVSKITVHPLKLYKKLRELNPAPFAAYFDLGACQLLSASPERFLHVNSEGCVETRPIKGTRRRDVSNKLNIIDETEDLAYSIKNRSENIMIVDLLRNDLGRVCSYKSIYVTEVCEIETFRYIHHLVSEIKGYLNPGTTIADLLAATFPGGSVTGAPKVRAMEIIAELEPNERNFYCGSLGWFGLDKCLDLSIIIRTAIIHRGYLYLSVGSGVTSDSSAMKEYDETLLKASGFLSCLVK